MAQSAAYALHDHQSSPETIPALGQALIAPRLDAASSPPRLLDAASRRALMADTQALILAGGAGTRLGDLTARRAKPAVAIAGRFRIIDFTLSNCLNSGIPQVGVLTQYLSHSLVPHLDTWNRTARELGLRMLPARDNQIYQGTADAVYQNRDVIRSRAASQVFVLAADHVYRMDYAPMLAMHRSSGAQLTVGCVEVPLAAAREFGVMAVDRRDRVTEFAEKPQYPNAIPGRPDLALASMGIYLFDTDFLLRTLTDDAQSRTSSHDFGKDIIPAALATGVYVGAYRLRDPVHPQQPAYWRDVGTIDTYWLTNLELAHGTAVLALDDPAWPIRSTWAASNRPEKLPASGNREDHHPEIGQSLVFPDAEIGPGSVLENCVVLPGARIGAGCRLRNAVIDEGCELPPGTVVGANPEHDRYRYRVTPAGVVLIAR